VRNNDRQVFEFLTVKDPTVRVLKLLRGEVDLLQNDLQPELLTYLTDQHEVSIGEGDGSNFTYLGFNLQDPLVGQHEVRLAIAHAIDRDAIIRYLWGGAARPANALLPPDHWAGNSEIPNYEYNPEKSRQILDKLGYGLNNPLHLTYKTSSDAFRIRLATVIQQQLAEVGIEVELKTYDWGTFYGDIKAGRFQMYSLSWVGIKTPDIFHYAFHSDSVPPAGANRGRFSDEQADALIEQADQGDTLDKQAGVYRELQYLLWQTLPYVPMWYEDNVYVARNNIEGYRLAVDGNYDGLMYVKRTRLEIAPTN
jgi:peptide/nickel transport system substrate-binding protein